MVEEREGAIVSHSHWTRVDSLFVEPPMGPKRNVGEVRRLFRQPSGPEDGFTAWAHRLRTEQF